MGRDQATSDTGHGAGGDPEATPSGSCLPIVQLADFTDPKKSLDDAFRDASAAAQQCGGGVVQISPSITDTFTVTSSSPSIAVIDDRHGIRRTEAAESGEFVGSSGPKASVVVCRTRENAPGFYLYTDSAQGTRQRNIHGGSSVRTKLLSPVLRNTKDARWYPASIAGFYVKQLFVIGNHPPFITVKELGWDANRTAPYFVADSPDVDIPAGTLLTNKSDLRALTIVEESHCDNQCAGTLGIEHYTYGQGDTFGASMYLEYMGEVISAGGDEGGVGCVVELKHQVRNFQAAVSSFNPDTGVLMYQARQDSGKDVTPYANRLGTSRPLINLNPNKWIKAGAVRLWSSGTGPNRAYPYGVVEGIGTNWTKDIVGRYFALDEKSEYIEPTDSRIHDPGYRPQTLLRRWFRILRLVPGTAGAQLLFVAVHPGGDGDITEGVPVLADTLKYHNEDNKQLSYHYVIAPGALVADVRQAVNATVAQVTHNQIILQPNGDFANARSTGYPFAPGDPIEQAIGAAPWNPTGFRVRHFNNLPCNPSFGDASFYTVNGGSAPVNAGLLLAGAESGDLATAATKYRPVRGDSYAYGSAIDVRAVSRVGINFWADMPYQHAVTGSGPAFMKAFVTTGHVLAPPDAGLGILFNQANGNRKVIAWNPKGAHTVYATLGYDPDKHEYFLRGGVTVNITRAGLTATRGISATDTKSTNLRGINVPTTATASQPKDPFMDIAFVDDITVPGNKTNSPEPDTAYAIQVTPSWLTTVAVPQNHKATERFRVIFGTPAPAGATLDWVLIR